MKRILLLLLFVPVTFISYAVPASPEPFFVEQADGSLLQVRMMGDEFGGYLATDDGWAIRKDPSDNAYKYLFFTEKGGTRLTDMVAHNASLRDAEEQTYLSELNQQLPLYKQQRQKRKIAAQTQIASTFPLKGSPHSVVILVNFSDLQFSIPNPKETYTRLLNQSGYAENDGVGSARDYFIASSDSVFQPVFDVVGPYTLPNNMAYYGANSGSSNSVRASEMVVDACSLAEAAGIDFKQYDTDGNGTIDNVFIYYAGHNEAEGADENTIWPHRSTVQNASAIVSGVRIYDYACTSELRGRSGVSMCGIGTFCHEFGHVLGLPDFYDTENEGHYTVGSWDIMCSGSYNGNGKTPPSYTAFERFSLGWLTPVVLENAGRYQLQPLLTSGQAFLIPAGTYDLNPTTNAEYFILENRQHVGWDTPATSLVGTGMLVWHIDYNNAAWNNNTPNNNAVLRYHVEPAHGRTQTSSLPSEPFPGTNGITNFSPVLHNGTPLNAPLLNIEQVGEDITFIFKGEGATKFVCTPAELGVFQSTYDPLTRKATYELQTLDVAGRSLDPKELVTFATRSDFQLSVDGDNWTTSYETYPEADSTLNVKLYLRYNPRKMVCSVAAGNLTISTFGSQVLFTLQGVSPRPVYITTPKLDTPIELSPYSFKVTWEPQADAEDYYLTLFSQEPGTTAFMQSFEEFSSESEVLMQDWYANFLTTTSSAASNGSRSLWFRYSGDSIASETYVQPITSLSFWLNAVTTEVENVGHLLLWGFNGKQWKQVDDIAIRNNTKRSTKTYTFDQTDNYTRFALRFVDGGGAGVAVDAFEAICPVKINYIFSKRDKQIPVILNQEGKPSVEHAYCYFDNLTPNTEYFCQIRSGEQKGCSENLSNLSEPLLVKTLEGEQADNRFLSYAIDSLSYSRAMHVVYVPKADATRSLYIYDVYGHLVYSTPVQAMQNIVPLPTERFVAGNIYIVKYSVTNRVKRKDKWVKIMF